MKWDLHQHLVAIWCFNPCFLNGFPFCGLICSKCSESFHLSQNMGLLGFAGLVIHLFHGSQDIKKKTKKSLGTSNDAHARWVYYRTFDSIIYT